MTITLQTEVKNLKGVGPAKAAGLARLGIETVDQLLSHYPSGYTFAPEVLNTSLWGLPKDGETTTRVGVVACINKPNRHNGTFDFGVTLESGIRVKWYGGQYLRNQIFRGTRLMVSGVVRDGCFTNPEFKVLKPGETPNPADLNTVTYPVASGITNKDIGRLVRQAMDGLDIPYGGRPGMRWLHTPSCRAEANTARHDLKYDELFYMQLGLAVRRAQQTAEQSNVRCIVPPQSIWSYFPFAPTMDQMTAVSDIQYDLYQSRPMNRLLQGDVGCGKTAVAAYAAIVMAFNGGQTAILCPTEVLARQHYNTIKGFFDRAGVKCDLLLGGGGLPLAADATPCDIVVGTTALLSSGVRFSRLGLVIIDEQHKFGVEQRAALKRHGNPHMLVMTATPIPRTLAMTVFGDLDISTIKSMPPGRSPVETHWCRDGADHQYMRDVLQSELQQGHQVYVVCPRIEALDDEMRAVEEVYDEYRNRFPQVEIGMLHGKMTPEWKDTVSQGWSRGDIQILVSTTVIEVGVDNPNATVMVVEGAERFGLAQLHQLRGRVGRGNAPSYCFLLSDTDSSEGKSRLKIMEKTHDGFEIAEHDLKMRGPGDLLSTRQHGLPDLKLANLVEDFDLLLEARKDAFAIAEADPALSAPEHRAMRSELLKRFGEKLEMGDVG